MNAKTTFALGFLASVIFLCNMASPNARAIVGIDADFNAECDASRAQVQIDTTSRHGSMCFELERNSLARVNVEKAYGVHNRSDQTIYIALRTNEGMVFWELELAPGELSTLDVDRRRSRVVEIRAGQPGQPGTISRLEEGELVSFSVSGGSGNRFLGFAPGQERAGIQELSLASNFEDRLDATFRVRSPLDPSRPECRSFEMVNYPGVYLTVVNVLGTTLRSVNPDPQAATWCFEGESGSAAVWTKWAGTRMWLSVAPLGQVQSFPLEQTKTQWSIREGLSDPQ